ncbi:MAG TPA: YCF48-related protein [Gemmatimonadaceae bacterium]|nr:YCF48-related protein [Gemmatimonadaceae bacterium]
MSWFIQKAALATLVAVLASDAFAQPTAQSATLRAEWRAPLPRTELQGRYKAAELYAVEFLNHNIGWAVGGQSGTKSTMLFGTKDGGKTWERQTLFDGELSSLTDIGFADANNGWIVGRSQILRTTDGGESWGPVNQPERGSYGAHKLLVLGPDAIIVGSDVENAQILRTVDGGGTWEVIALVKDGGGGAGSNNTVSGLALAEPSTVFATTGTRHGNRGVIYRSNDGGSTWEVVEEADRPLLGIAFRGRRGVAVGVNIAFWTEDGGNTWRRVAIPGNQYAVDFADDNTVVAVGDRPHVVISRNGGKTWQPLSAPLQHGNLVDIEAVDPGWWFVAGGYGANALYHYVDPNHTEPIVSGTVPLPVDVQTPGGGGLPRGMYDVTLAHKGDQHVVRLNRRGDVPAGADTVKGLERATTQQKGQRPPTCARPCQVTVPANVTYEKENAPGGGDPKSFFFRITLEPTPTGVAVVVRTAVTPPRNVALALAAVAAPKTSDTEARQVAQTTAQRGGGLLGRARRAAAGDVRGAVAGAVNPQATQQRLRAAKSAPPAVYKVTLRHTLDLFGGTQGARAP